MRIVAPLFMLPIPITVIFASDTMLRICSTPGSFSITDTIFGSVITSGVGIRYSFALKMVDCVFGR